MPEVSIASAAALLDGLYSRFRPDMVALLSGLTRQDISNSWHGSRGGCSTPWPFQCQLKSQRHNDVFQNKMIKFSGETSVRAADS
jgi:TPP-dependent pyruvate/acetoin dehydrogenase alpha subunit